MIYESINAFEVIQIDSLTANSITAKQNISRVFSTRAIVCPVVPCRMLSSPRRETSGYNVRVKAAFEAVSNIQLPTSPSADQYLGLDVFLDQPLTSNGRIPDVYDSRVDTVDYGSNDVEIFGSWTNTKVARQFELEFSNQADLWAFRLWLHRREGKQRPFWMPTFEENFRLVTTGLLGAQITVINDGQLLYGENRTHIAVKSTSGWQFALITNMVSNGSNIDIDLDLNLNINADTVEIICYLGQKRLGSDRIRITHDANFVSSVSLPIVEVLP